MNKEPTAQTPIKVLIVDDHVMVRRGLISLLETYPDLKYVAEASDGEAAVLMYEHSKPDVVLMDLMMPHMDGVAATQKIRERYPNAKIVALTSFATDELVQRALQAGVLGYLLKNATAEELAKAIRNAHDGKRVLASEAADVLVHAMHKEPVPGDDLTEREREVLALMVEGLNNGEIAERLFLSVSTIKFHVSAILSKMAVTNRIEAVALAVQHGIVSKPNPKSARMH